MGVGVVDGLLRSGREDDNANSDFLAACSRTHVSQCLDRVSPTLDIDPEEDFFIDENDFICVWRREFSVEGEDEYS